MLEIRNVTKIYKSKTGTEVKALDDVSIRFPETGMVFVLGKSGSGKSTLLNVIGGLDGCDGGEFIIKGKSSKAFAASDFDAYRNTFVGFIFQEYNILDDFSVGANIGLALELQGRKAESEKISEILAEVDLLNYAKRKPNELSGGQKQRIAIARALVKDPEIIMADEPTGALDSNTGKQIFDTLKELSRRKLVIVVSHDRDFAERYGDRIIEMQDGKILSDVTKHEVEAEAVSAGILKMNDSLLRIEKGYQLTPKDVELINAYLRERDTDILVSGDTRVNASVRSAAGITENNKSSVFRGTDEKNDVKTKLYGKEDARFIRSRLPMRNAMKMGASGLGHKKFRLVLTVFLSLIAFALFGFADTMGAYNRHTTAVRSIRDSHIANASFTLGVLQTYAYPDGEIDKYYVSSNLNDADVKALGEKLGMEFVPVYNGHSNAYSSISITHMMQTNDAIGGAYSGQLYGFAAMSEKQLADLGFAVTGVLPTERNEIALPKLIYEQLRENGLRAADGSTVEVGKLTMTDTGKDANSIIGKEIRLSVNGYEASFKVTAVIDTAFDYDRYADYVPTIGGGEMPNEQSGILDMVMAQELDNTLRYGFHSLGYLSAEGLKILSERVPSFGSAQVGTPMDWNTAVYRSVDGSAESILWLGRVAGSETLSSMKIRWLDGVERTELSENEIVLSARLLDYYRAAANLRGMIGEEAKAILGSYWKDSYVDADPSAYLAEAAVCEAVDGQFAEYADRVRKLFGVPEMTDAELRTFWIDRYEEVASMLNSDGAEGIPLREDLLAEKARPILSKILGVTVRGSYPTHFYMSMLWSLENDFYESTLTELYARISAYDEMLEKKEALYRMDGFYEAVIERHIGEAWLNLSESERLTLAAQAYAEYVAYETYEGNRFGKTSLGDFAEAGAERFDELSDVNYAELLKDAYITTQSYWGDDKETRHDDLKIVGVYLDGNEYDDLIISDTFAERYEAFRTEMGLPRVELYPHEDGIYAFAIAPMPQDEETVRKMVDLTYSESEGLCFTMQNQVMNTLAFFNEFIEIGSTVFFWVGVGFAVFSALMLMNFISVSISYKRREIGILRAVGARSSDVFKIFFSEAFMIALINYVLSICATVAAVWFFNYFVRREGINVTLLSFGVRQVLLMLVISVAVAAIASFLPVWSIARRRPVDAIKNK